MSKRRAILACFTVFLLAQTALAESADYHLKRLEIQARAFLAQLGAESDLVPPPEMNTAEPDVVNTENQAEPIASATIDKQLEQAVEAPSWAENMAREDIKSLLATSQALREQLAKGDTDEYLKAKVELDSIARRLRVSTSPLDLSPQQTANLEMVMLELEQSTSAVSNTREQILTRKQARQHRNNINVGLGLGYGAGYGAFSPWGYSPWGLNGFGGFGGFGYGPFFRPGFVGSRRRVFRRRRCR